MSTLGAIHMQDDDGEDEVTSPFRPLGIENVDPKDELASRMENFKKAFESKKTGLKYMR